MAMRSLLLLCLVLGLLLAPALSLEPVPSEASDEADALLAADGTPMRTLLSGYKSKYYYNKPKYDYGKKKGYDKKSYKKKYDNKKSYKKKYGDKKSYKKYDDKKSYKKKYDDKKYKSG